MAAIQFSYSENIPLEYAISHYSQLAFPHLKTRINNKKLLRPLIGVMAKNGEEIVGMALSSNEQSGISEIISLKVKEEFRLKGIGKKLIRQTLKIQGNLGFEHSRIMFYEHWKNLKFIQSLIRSELWSQPKPVMHRYEHHYKKNKHKILPAEIGLDPSYSFQSFEHLNEPLKLAFLQGAFIKSKEDQKFSFRSYTDRFSEKISTILMQDGNPIGWCIAVEASSDSIDHNLYILPNYRKDPNLPMALISKNWVAQMQSDYDKAVWIIDAANPQMVKFMERKLPHLIDFKSTLFVISKDLNQD